MIAMQDSDVLAETENMSVWRSEEDQVGYMFHVEMGGISHHHRPEEWDELVVWSRSTGK